MCFTMGKNNYLFAAQVGATKIEFLRMNCELLGVANVSYVQMTNFVFHHDLIIATNN